MAAAARESVLCVKADVKVYRIPPRVSNRGHRAADWKLDEPDWSGRLRVTTKGDTAYVKLEDRVTGELFAEAPVESYPSVTIESVTDSSRYFVLCIQDGSGRRAFIGVGFHDREDAFDFNVALQDHFKWVKQDAEVSKREQELEPCPKLDLGFKEGETIQLQIGNMKRRDRSRPRAVGGGAVPLLLPPGGRFARAGGSPIRAAEASLPQRGRDTALGTDHPDMEPAPTPLSNPSIDVDSPQSGWVQF
ncbi:adaptin ear-binding coat-associated protein 1-like [Scyliorhinus torazame]|uniref:adaptin ear-binding coat-associated protein 1-like n=1 Tax=Scyliorhinus torazame TaxID=75743 RepID=UPI003B58C13B